MHKLLPLTLLLTIVGCGSGSDSSSSTSSVASPDITSTAETQATEGVEYRYDLTATDADTHISNLEWSSTLPSWLNLEASAAKTAIAEGNLYALTTSDSGNVYGVVQNSGPTCVLVEINADRSLNELGSFTGWCYGMLAVGSKVFITNGHTSLSTIHVYDTANPSGGITVIAEKPNSHPIGITEKDGYLYVANMGDNTIDKIEINNLSNRTEYLSVAGAPYGLGFAGNGDLYVSLYGADKVVRYNSSLELDSNFAIELIGPTDVKVDDYDNLYISNIPFLVSQDVLDNNFFGVQRFDVSTLVASQIDAGGVWGMTLDRQGLLLWANTETTTAYKLNTLAKTLSGTPERAHVGDHEISISVSDGTNKDTQEFTLTVAAVNTDPTGSVTITGDLIRESTLTATNDLADVEGLGDFSYQWYANGEAIDGATNSSYVLTTNEIGDVITVSISYTDGFDFEESVLSAETAEVADLTNNDPTGTVTISGTLEEGQTLTASNDLADADGLGSITYQWYADGEAISGATSDTLELTAELAGAVITVTASYTDGKGFENDATSASSTPVVALTNNRIQAIDNNGSLMAVLMKDGTVQVWGDNSHGTLGYTPGTNNDLETDFVYYNPNAATISGLSNVVSIATGYRFVIALKSDGTVWTWGRNENGELGHEPGTNGDVNLTGDYALFDSDSDFGGTVPYNATPVQVSGLTGITAIAASYASGYALKDDGTVWAWGDNFSGQLGVGTNSNQSHTPVQVKDSAGTGTLSNIIAIFASDLGAAFAADSTGKLWAWGGNSNGGLGFGDTADRSLPAEHSLTDVVNVAVSGEFGVALLEDGSVWDWSDVSTPSDRSLGGVSEIAVESNGAIALQANGTTKAWGPTLLGGNSNGQLGDGTTNEITTPTTVMANDTFVHVAKGEFFTAAIKDDGTLKVWGGNAYGQLGHAPNTNGDTTSEFNDIYNLSGVIVDGIAANSLAAPAGASATAGDNLIFSWTNVDGADSYNVYWSTTPDVNPANGTKITDATNGAALQTLTQGQRYHLIVTAVDAAGNESVGSLEVTIDFPVTP